jgi:hypothetical protein
MRSIANEARTFFVGRYGKVLPFATVMCDHLDKPEDILGVSLIILNPRTWTPHHFALCLLPSKGHKAEVTKQQIEEVLFDRVGISFDEVANCMTDTTNSAQKTSRLVTGKDTADKCNMHVWNLVLGHTTGLKKRSGEAYKFVYALYLKGHRLSMKLNGNWSKEHLVANGGSAGKQCLPGETNENQWCFHYV